MPRGDGTGPAGMGPMTGRAAGYCAGYAAPGFTNPRGGRGLGLARGRGGWGRGIAWGRGGRWGIDPGLLAPPDYGPVPLWQGTSAGEELAMLRDEADWLKEQMDAVNQRIQELQEDGD